MLNGGQTEWESLSWKRQKLWCSKYNVAKKNQFFGPQIKSDFISNGLSRSNKTKRSVDFKPTKQRLFFIADDDDDDDDDDDGIDRVDVVVGQTQTNRRLNKIFLLKQSWGSELQLVFQATIALCLKT